MIYRNWKADSYVDVYVYVYVMFSYLIQTSNLFACKQRAKPFLANTQRVK